MVPIHNRPVQNRPLKTDHSEQTTFITDLFKTDHFDNEPRLNVYSSVDAKSPNHFA